MNRKLNLGLSLAAGLLGGLLSGVFFHYVTPTIVHAQTPEPPKTEVVPQQVSAHTFVLVNDAGKTVGRDWIR